MDGIKIGLIGGSGLADAMRARTDADGGGLRHSINTPFGRTSDAIVETSWSGLPVFFLSRHGPGHPLNPSQVPYRANIFALKKLGVTHLIASGAVGSLRDDFKPRDLVIPDQLIDKTFRRPGTFYERAAVHVEFSEPFCQVLRRMLVEEGAGGIEGLRDRRIEGLKETALPIPQSPDPSTPLFHPEPFLVHDRGCYVCMEGPAFSTRAESLMHRLWGGDLIGMTAMPEAKLAREAEISYALVALVTDYDCWRRPPAAAAGPGRHVPGPTETGKTAAELARNAEKPANTPPPDPYVLLKEIIANLQAATDNAVGLIQRTVARMAQRQAELAAAPAREALRLAIWSDKSCIPQDEVELLAPLWMKYFER